MEAVEKARNCIEQAGSGTEQAKVIGHHLWISTYGENLSNLIHPSHDMSPGVPITSFRHLR